MFLKTQTGCKRVFRFFFSKTEVPTFFFFLIQCRTKLNWDHLNLFWVIISIRVFTWNMQDSRLYLCTELGRLLILSSSLKFFLPLWLCSWIPLRSCENFLKKINKKCMLRLNALILMNWNYTTKLPITSNSSFLNISRFKTMYQQQGSTDCYLSFFIDQIAIINTWNHKLCWQVLFVSWII